MNFTQLPQRKGVKPNTTSHIPHEQLDQNSDPEMFNALASWMFSLPDVREEPTRISVPGARAMFLDEAIVGNPRAFMVAREFAHIHPEPLPGSLHLNLAPEDADHVISLGWGENHFLVDRGVLPPGCILVYAPRNNDDLTAIKAIISQSLAYARDKGAVACACCTPK